MSTLTSAPAVPRVRTTRPRATRIGTWAARILLSAQFIAGGALKLTGEASMVAMFDDIGVGAGLRLFVGACEVAGAVGLLVPRLVRPAATGLVLLMVGAVITNVAILQTDPVLPLVFGVLAGVVVASSRKGNAR
jgi:putative oxidoreductase